MSWITQHRTLRGVYEGTIGCGKSKECNESNTICLGSEIHYEFQDFICSMIKNKNFDECLIRLLSCFLPESSESDESLFSMIAINEKRELDQCKLISVLRQQWIRDLYGDGVCIEIMYPTDPDVVLWMHRKDGDELTMLQENLMDREQIRNAHMLSILRAEGYTANYNPCVMSTRDTLESEYPDMWWKKLLVPTNATVNEGVSMCNKTKNSDIKCEFSKIVDWKGYEQLWSFKSDFYTDCASALVLAAVLAKIHLRIKHETKKSMVMSIDRSNLSVYIYKLIYEHNHELDVKILENKIMTMLERRWERSIECFLKNLGCVVKINVFFRAKVKEDIREFEYITTLGEESVSNLMLQNTAFKIYYNFMKTKSFVVKKIFC